MLSLVPTRDLMLRFSFAIDQNIGPFNPLSRGWLFSMRLRRGHVDDAWLFLLGVTVSVSDAFTIWCRDLELLIKLKLHPQKDEETHKACLHLEEGVTDNVRSLWGSVILKGCEQVRRMC